MSASTQAAPLNRRKNDAFTLVELLVVTGILAVLTSCLLPSLCKSKARAKSAVCKSNLTQLGIALSLYVADFSKYPSEAEWSGNALDWNAAKLLPYVSNSRAVFVCPARKPFVSATEPEDAYASFSYGHNSLGSGHWDSPNLGMGYRRRGYIQESQIKQPSDMIAVGDVGVGAVFDWLLNPNADLLTYDETLPSHSWLPADRHSSGANILCCDGHVEWATRSRWIEETDAARRRWNNDHEPHRGTW